MVSLDWVELRRGFRALVASVCTRRGRALPVAWKVVHREKFRRSQNAVEDAFVERLAAMLDVGRSCIVADRGFRRATFLSLLNSLGFGYVIRVCGKVHVSGRKYTGLLEGCGLKEGRDADLGPVDYREDGQARTRLVWRWNRAQDEPWLLATNLPTRRATLQAYRLRMWVEEMFGDLKRHGFDLESTHVRHFIRLSRLTLLVVLLYLFLITNGVQVIKNGWRHQVDRPDRRDLSVFQIGLRFIQRELINSRRVSMRLLPGRSFQSVR